MPGSRVDLSISVDSLLRLPEGASYRRSNERAHVEASQRDGVIYISSTCDSLERQVEYYEALYRNARKALESYRESVVEEREKMESPFDIYLGGVACGVALTVAVFGFIKQSKSRKDE